MGDAPWPPNYAKQAGEPPRVQPSASAAADAEYERAAARTAVRHPRWPPNARPPWPPATRTPACRPSGTARARRHRPPQDDDPGHRDLARRVEGRGPRGPRALEGAPPRGRRAPRAGRRPGRRDARPSSLWYRVRVNLIHVPEAERPARNRSTPTTTRGRATNGPTGLASWSGRRRRSRKRRVAAPSPATRSCPLPASTTPERSATEDLLDQVRRRRLELVVAAVPRAACRGASA